MTEREAMSTYNLLVEARLTKIESESASMKDDIKEIKRNIRWLLGIIFSLNSTIIGLLAKSLSMN